MGRKRPHRKLVRRIRERMKKTGESYAIARLHVEALDETGPTAKEGVESARSTSSADTDNGASVRSAPTKTNDLSQLIGARKAFKQPSSDTSFRVSKAPPGAAALSGLDRALKQAACFGLAIDKATRVQREVDDLTRVHRAMDEATLVQHEVDNLTRGHSAMDELRRVQREADDLMRGHSAMDELRRVQREADRLTRGHRELGGRHGFSLR